MCKINMYEFGPETRLDGVGCQVVGQATISNKGPPHLRSQKHEYSPLSYEGFSIAFFFFSFICCGISLFS